jgi:hypothetical protein
MPDTWEVQTPDGSTIEIQSDRPPSAADALRAVRAYGDMQAKSAQEKAQAGSTLGSQLTGANVLHDLGQWGSGTLSAGKAFVKQAITNPLGVAQPEIKATDRPASLSADLGRLRTLPARAWEAAKDPIGALQAAGVTPDIAAQFGGEVSAGAAAPVLAHGATKITPAGIGNAAVTTGERLTALGESPTYGKLSRGAGAFLGNKVVPGAGGLIGGAIVGDVVPAATGGMGRLLTRAGRTLAPEGASVKYTPSNETPRPLTPDEIVPSHTKYTPSDETPRPLAPDEAVPSYTRYTPSDETPRPLTPDEIVPPAPGKPIPVLRKGEAPKLQNVLRDVLEEVRAEPSDTGTTPPDVTMTPTGVPSVTPLQYEDIEFNRPPTGTTREINPPSTPPAPRQGVLRTQSPAAPPESAPAAEPAPMPELDDTSVPRATRRKAMINDDVQSLVDETVKAAKEGGFQGDEGGLRKALIDELNSRMEFLKDNARDVGTQDRNPLTLLRDIAKGGGISLPQETGLKGELAWLKEMREPNGAMNGVKGVFHDSGGMTVDGALEYLTQDGRYPHLQSINDLLDAIREAGNADKQVPAHEQLMRGTTVDGLLDTMGLNKPDVTFDPGEFEGEAQGRLPGAEGARQVGKPPTMQAPQQASGGNFELDARTAAQKAADDAAEAARQQGPGLFEPPEPVTQEARQAGRHELGSAEQARAEGVKRGEILNTTETIDSKKTGEIAGIIPSKRWASIVAKAKALIDAGATDQELRDHIDYRADGKPSDPKTRGQMIQLFRTLGRPVYSLGAAAVGGAGLRKALVNQLQEKDEQ